MLWLATILVTPFATRVITADGAFGSRFTFYAGVQALAGLCFFMIVRTVDRHGLSYRAGRDKAIATGYRRSATVALVFLGSIPSAWFTHWAYAVWALLPVVG